MNFHRALLLTLLLAASLLQAQGREERVRRYDANATSHVSFEIRESKDPVFPLSMKRLGYDKGVAIFAIFINQFGELADYLPLEATHIDFAEAVEKVLPDWDYSVPYVDGKTAAIVSRIKVTFERGKGVVYETTGYDHYSHVNALHETQSAYRTYSVAELDSIPEPIHIEKPAFHIELLEERNLVNAVFEFYIDENGKVRMPTLREADDKVDERLLILAQEALLQWRFNAPTRDGQPVVARTALPFRFKKRDTIGLVE